jgi:hypothetical protein
VDQEAMAARTAIILAIIFGTLFLLKLADLFLPYVLALFFFLFSFCGYACLHWLWFIKEFLEIAFED